MTGGNRTGTRGLLRVGLATCLLAIAAGGCGGSSTPSSSSASAGAASAYCSAADTKIGQIQTLLAKMPAEDKSDYAVIQDRADIAHQIGALEHEIADSAPPSVKADFNVVYDAMSASDDVRNRPSTQAMAAAAKARVELFTQRTCKLDISPAFV